MSCIYYRHRYWYYMHIMVYPLHCCEFILNLCLVRIYYIHVPMYSMYACKQNKFPEMDNKIELKLNWIEFSLGPPVVAVRLVDGARDNEGRVELFNDEAWGTVCDDSWDINDAMVVCKQLGYRTALEAPVAGRYGAASASMPILLDNLMCVGTEASLFECGHSGIGVHNCGHSEDAGAVCSNESNCLPYLSVRNCLMWLQ